MVRAAGRTLQSMFVLVLALATWTETMKSGNAALDKGRHSEAASHFETALRIASTGPERAAALNNLAAVEETRGNLDRAERLYRECIEAWTSAEAATVDALARPLNNLAVLHRRKGEYAQAAELYQRSLALRPENANVLSNLGRMYFVQRRFSEAEDYFQRALAVTPNHPATLANLAELQLATKRFEAAKRSALRLVALEADKPLEIVARLALAGAAREEKSWKGAEAHLLRAIALSRNLLGEDHPLTACAYAEYAYIARKLKRKGEALDYEERAKSVIGRSEGRHTVSLSELLETHRR